MSRCIIALVLEKRCFDSVANGYYRSNDLVLASVKKLSGKKTRFDRNNLVNNDVTQV